MASSEAWALPCALIVLALGLVRLSARMRRRWTLDAQALETIGLALNRVHLELHDAKAALRAPSAIAPVEDAPPLSPSHPVVPREQDVLPPLPRIDDSRVDQVPSTVPKPGPARFQISRHINIEILPGLEGHLSTIARLRAEAVTAAGGDPEAWLDDRQAWRFLVARKFDLDAARKQAIAALHWRAFRRPHMIRAEPELAVEAATGKVCVRGLDCYGRPVLVLDSSKENTFHADANMKLLAYQIERAIRLMKPPVDKYVVVVRLGETSMSTLPGPVVTRETLKMLMTVYAERMGTAILYMPPKLFTFFLNLFNTLLDAHVMRKVVWISGDVSKGSSNDKILTQLMGDQWRVLVGEGQPIHDPKAAPGFDYAVEWKKMLEDEKGIDSKVQ